MKPYYKDDDCVIYNCDAYELLVDSDIVADVIITDPPYVVDAVGGGIASKRQYIRRIQNFTDGGFDMSILDHCENWMCFCAKSQLVDLITKADTKVSNWMLLTWNKPNPTPFVNGNYLPDTEYIVHKYRRNRLYGGYADKARYIVHPARQNLSHPNEKPLPVMAKLVNLASTPGQIVLDPFMGSGTTLVATKGTGRFAIGIEREERYCEIAARRMQQGVLDL